MENESYTNLLAVRGRARFEELRRQLARRLEALQGAASEVVAAEEDRARRAVDDLTRHLVFGRSP